MSKIAEDIAEIKTDVSWIKKTLEVHMSQHFKVRLALLGTIIAAAVAVLLTIM